MLYLFGGPVLEGFSLTMLIGVSIGTASLPIYVASALALKLGMKREHMLQQKVEKRGGSAVHSAVNAYLKCYLNRSYDRDFFVCAMTINITDSMLSGPIIPPHEFTHTRRRMYEN